MLARVMKSKSSNLKRKTMSKSTIVTVLSYILLISSAACFTATMSVVYVTIMVLSILGMVSGALMADDELKQAEADRQFTNRLNK
jgi:hypothetical protein|tara:strand:- start:150 stop:404 length:255 start_codon:yes stop_codon:yes gene_type:complete